MTIFKHELKQGRNSLIIWTASVSFLILVCVLMFPQMKGEMEDVGEMFSSMGSFTQAFGMDQLNFGTLIGFYGIECGNILGLGGAFFAALCAVSMLAKEEKEHTAEFLLTHPVSRGRVVTEKFASIIVEGNFITALCIFSAAGPDCRYLFRYFRVPAPGKSGNRSGTCSFAVFSESDCQYFRNGGFS